MDETLIKEVKRVLIEHGDIQGVNYKLMRAGVPDFADWDEVEWHDG